MLTINVLKNVMKERFKAFKNDGLMFSINGQSPHRPNADYYYGSFNQNNFSNDF